MFQLKHFTKMSNVEEVYTHMYYINCNKKFQKTKVFEISGGWGLMSFLECLFTSSILVILLCCNIVLMAVQSMCLFLNKKPHVPCAAPIEKDKQNTKPSFLSTETHNYRLHCILFFFNIFFSFSQLNIVIETWCWQLLVTNVSEMVSAVLQIRARNTICSHRHTQSCKSNSKGKHCCFVCGQCQ